MDTSTPNPTPDDWNPSEQDTPFDRLGGAEAVRELTERFYDAMSDHEAELTRLHVCDAQGRVSRESRDHFGLFLIGWLGGPQDYIAQRGHPRLRMRHGTFEVNVAMRDAWLRSMQRALDEMKVGGGLRRFLNERFAHVANFLRNVEESP